MDDSLGPDPQPTSRRRRADAGASGLSVADLLARHAADSGAETGAPTPHRAPPHRARPEPDETDRFAAMYPSGDPLFDPLPDPLGSPSVGPLGSPSADQGRTEQLFLGPVVDPRRHVLSASSGQPDPDDAPTAVVPAATPEPATPESAIPEPSTPEPSTPEPEAPADPTATAEVDPEDGFDLRCRKIDETLTRLTAIHAGMGAEMTDRVSRSSRLPVVDRTADGLDIGEANGAPSATEPSPGRVALVRGGKVLALAMAAVLFVATGVGWGAKEWLDTKLRPVAALDPNSDAIVDPDAQYGDENFLLVGSDTRAGADAADGVGSAAAVPGVRSDTVMLAHIPAKRDRVVLVSFPRDLEVDRPSCDRWDPASAQYPGGTAPAQSDVKINTAFEVGGPRCVTKVVQKLTGLSVNHFTAIDFVGFKEMVDSVQGVPICVDRPVVDTVLGRVVPTAGQTVLAGDQALAFVRARNVRGDPTSDYRRIERQQRFLSALLRKGTSDQVLANPGQLSDFVTAFGNHTLSDNAGLDELTMLASSLQSLDPAEVTFVTVPTSGGPDGQGNEVLRRSDTAALFEAIRDDRPLPGEAAGGDDSTRGPDLAANDTVPSSEVDLTVRNGSSKAGVANQAADSLRTVGFTVSGVGDAPPSAGGQTVIRHSPDRADQAATLAQAVPGAVSQSVPGPPGVLELVLGDGFDGEVKAAASSSDGGLPSNLATVDGADASCR